MDQPQNVTRRAVTRTDTLRYTPLSNPGVTPSYADYAAFENSMI